MVYNWIKRSVGLDKCKYFMSGGAPLLKSVQQNLMSLDLHVVEVYYELFLLGHIFKGRKYSARKNRLFERLTFQQKKNCFKEKIKKNV